jgi:hypothetical protein
LIRGGEGFWAPELSTLNIIVFPQIGEKYLPRDGQDAISKGAYRVLANQDIILEYAFFF